MRQLIALFVGGFLGAAFAAMGYPWHTWQFWVFGTPLFGAIGYLSVPKP
jgi:hypothetical protein